MNLTRRGKKVKTIMRFLLQLNFKAFQAINSITFYPTVTCDWFNENTDGIRLIILQIDHT